MRLKEQGIYGQPATEADRLFEFQLRGDLKFKYSSALIVEHIFINTVHFINYWLAHSGPGITRAAATRLKVGDEYIWAA